MPPWMPFTTWTAANCVGAVFWYHKIMISPARKHTSWLVIVLSLPTQKEESLLLPPRCILRYSQEYFEAWLEGYRSVRPFSQHDEKAVAASCIIGDLRLVAWSIGVARSSHGKPLLGTADLPGAVDAWLDWERKHLS